MSKKKLAREILDLMLEAEKNRGNPGGWFLVQAFTWGAIMGKCEKVLGIPHNDDELTSEEQS